MKINATLYRVGAEAPEEIVVENATFTKLKDLIGARNGEYVYEYFLDDENPRAMLVDEEGILEGKERNHLATEKMGTVLFGDALFLNMKEIDNIPYK